MNKSLLSIVLIIIAQACNPSPESAKSLSLPQGDAIEGEKVLIKY